MNISDYYTESAKALLNSSILFLLPAILLVILNIAYLGNRQVLLLCLPFIVISLVFYQIHLAKSRQAQSVGITFYEDIEHLPEAERMLVLYGNHVSPSILLFSPSGIKIGEIRKKKHALIQLFARRKEFVLYDKNSLPQAFYSVSNGKIDVYNSGGKFLGSLVEPKSKAIPKHLTSSQASNPKYVTGSRFFMDVKVEGEKGNQPCARLRRGMMPLEWGERFPNPNTPVFSLDNLAAADERFVYFSILIREFFVER